MKLKVRKLAVVIGVLLLCFGFCESKVSVQAASASGATEKAAKKALKSRWVKRKGAWYYYNSRGKLLKNGVYKVKGSLYQFDKTGKRISTKYHSQKFWYTFDRKTGKNTSIYTYLTIESVSPEFDSITGSRVERMGSTKTYERVSYRISAKNARIYNRNGKKINCSSLKKGDVIKVFTKSDFVYETGPAQFGPISKIRVIKTTAK